MGYILLTIINEDGYLEGNISELIALPDRLDIADALIKNACAFFKNLDVAAIYYPATKGHSYEGLFMKNGFLDASRLKTNFFQYQLYSDIIEESYFKQLSPTRIFLQYF